MSQKKKTNHKMSSENEIRSQHTKPQKATAELRKMYSYK